MLSYTEDIGAAAGICSFQGLQQVLFKTKPYLQHRVQAVP